MIQKPLSFVSAFGDDARILLRVKMPLECDNFVTSLSCRLLKGTTLYENISSLRRYARAVLKKHDALCVDVVIDRPVEITAPGRRVLLLCVEA